MEKETGHGVREKGNISIPSGTSWQGQDLNEAVKKMLICDLETKCTNSILGLAAAIEGGAVCLYTTNVLQPHRQKPILLEHTTFTHSQGTLGMGAPPSQGIL